MRNAITSAEWGELASAKRLEIQALSENISCNQKDKATIQQLTDGCSTKYFTIHTSDLPKYEKLKKEYLHYRDEQYASWHKEGLIVEPCHEGMWVTEQPIRLDCSSDKVLLITSENLDLQEARTLADASYEEITNFANGQTCTTGSSFTYTLLINYKSLKVEFIPYSRQVDYQELKNKISLYNRLAFRIVQEAGTGHNFRSQSQVESIICTDGRPMIKFRD